MMGQNFNIGNVGMQIGLQKDYNNPGESDDTFSTQEDAILVALVFKWGLTSWNKITKELN
jgi:hypothetical protein